MLIIELTLDRWLMFYITKNSSKDIGIYKPTIHLDSACWRLRANYREYNIPKEIENDPKQIEYLDFWIRRNKNKLSTLPKEQVAEQLSTYLKLAIQDSFIYEVSNSGVQACPDADMPKYLNEKGDNVCYYCSKE